MAICGIVVLALVSSFTISAFFEGSKNIELEWYDWAEWSIVTDSILGVSTPLAGGEFESNSTAVIGTRDG